jgi:hypothetical protein
VARLDSAEQKIKAAAFEVFIFLQFLFCFRIRARTADYAAGGKTDLVSIAGSKPTAFEAVSFLQVSPLALSVARTIVFRRPRLPRNRKKAGH